mgnify:CR=1 FL=1
MGWFEYILFYYIASSLLTTFFLIIKYGKKNPKINVFIYCMTALLFGWIITPIIIIDYVFMCIVFIVGWIVVKILDLFSI